MTELITQEEVEKILYAELTDMGYNVERSIDVELFENFARIMMKQINKANEAPKQQDKALHKPVVSFAKLKVCRCYEGIPKKDYDKCDICGKPYEYIR